MVHGDAPDELAWTSMISLSMTIRNWPADDCNAAGAAAFVEAVVAPDVIAAERVVSGEMVPGTGLLARSSVVISASSRVIVPLLSGIGLDPLCDLRVERADPCLRDGRVDRGF
jgi:hypothetical protein